MKRREWLGASCVAVLAGLALFLTWGTWPHAFVDFGRELYVPWRLVEGEVLYRDIRYFNGPFSPYLNALWFGVFGVSLRTLIVCNLAIVAGMTAALYVSLRRIGGPVAAATACALFVGVFAFCQFDPIGNDNYLTPYSHEMTHGLALGLLALLGLSRLPSRPLVASVWTGLALGFVFLTKAEIFLATGAAVATGLLLYTYESGGSLRHGARHAAITAAAALAPPLLAWTLLTLAMPAAEALRATLGSWPHVLAGEVAGQFFYRNTLGTLTLGSNLKALALWSLVWCLFAAVLFASARLCGEPKRDRAWLAPTSFALGFGLALGATLETGVQLVEATRPLPLFLTLLLAIDLAGAVRGRQRGDADVGRLLRVSFAAFALVLLAKVALRARIDQYGFALAMPGTLLAATLVVGALPAWTRVRGGEPAVVRWGAVGGLAAVIGCLLLVANDMAERRPTPVASGGDRFRAGIQAPVINALLADLERRSPAGATLAALPEGVMLNYLARRVNPTGHINFMPPELAMFGESAIEAAFERTPPDYIALVHKDTREYGVGFFGQNGYGEELAGWVREHYRPVERFGEPPFRPNTRFGILLLERR